MRRRMARKLGAFPVIYARTAAARSTWRRPTGPTTLRGEAAEIFTRWDAAWTASSHRGRRRGATLHPPGRSVRRVGIFRGCSGGATRCIYQSRLRAIGGRALGLILLLIVLVLLFGGGGFYMGPPFHLYGGGLGVILVIVIIVLLLRR